MSLAMRPNEVNTEVQYDCKVRHQAVIFLYTEVAAIEKAQSTDGIAIRDALAGLSIDAVTGALSFDANGDAVKSTAYIKQAIDGGFQFYKVQTAA